MCIPTVFSRILRYARHSCNTAVVSYAEPNFTALSSSFLITATAKATNSFPEVRAILTEEIKVSIEEIKVSVTKVLCRNIN